MTSKLIDINTTRRRPPGPRCLVYLDQSTLSRMVREPRFHDLRDELLAGVGAGLVICPRSPDHDDEARLARSDTWEQIDSLTHALSPGVRFRVVGEVENAEIRAAVRALLARSAEDPWRESFTTDPHTARKKTINIFGGEITVRARIPPDEADRAEVLHEKAKEEPLTAAYSETRDQFSFEEICNANLHQLLEWKLGPLASTSTYMSNLHRRAAEAETEQEDGLDPTRPGSAFRRLDAARQRGQFIMDLCTEFPELPQHAAELFYGADLRSMPTMTLYAYLRAGLASVPGRKSKRGDGYDVNHLVRGMSRCDVVTADRGMYEMVRARKLLPDACSLFESSDVDGLLAAIRHAVADRG